MCIVIFQWFGQTASEMILLRLLLISPLSSLTAPYFHNNHSSATNTSLSNSALSMVTNTTTNRRTSDDLNGCESSGTGYQHWSQNSNWTKIESDSRSDRFRFVINIYELSHIRPNVLKYDDSFSHICGSDLLRSLNHCHQTGCKKPNNSIIEFSPAFILKILQNL